MTKLLQRVERTTAGVVGATGTQERDNGLLDVEIADVTQGAAPSAEELEALHANAQ